MRRWHLSRKDPISTILAADARLSPTNRQDDQIWRVEFGEADAAALALQTTFGGRAGLVSLVPMWTLDGQAHYETATYHAEPIITEFAPGYLRIDAAPLPQLETSHEIWAAASNALTGTLIAKNTGEHTLNIRFDLFAHAIRNGQEAQIAVLTLANEEYALSLGNFENISPVIIMPGCIAGTGPDGHIAPKIGQDLSIEPGQQVKIRWSQAAVQEARNGLRLARYWVERDEVEIKQQIEIAATALPQIYTGDADLDATIAFGVQHTAAALVAPSAGAAPTLFAPDRAPNSGAQQSRHDRDHFGPVDYLLSTGLVAAAPRHVEDVFRAAIAHSTDQNHLFPVVARAVWHTYEITQNKDFVSDVFQPLLKTLESWLAQDDDGDGLPEWQIITQTRYAGWPAFAEDGVSIQTTETPDLAAYLLSEAQALVQMAFLLEDSDTADQLQGYIETLQQGLIELWVGERFVYRDRDTHHTTASLSLLHNARADEPQTLGTTLTIPARLVVEVVGGASNRPNFTITIDGLDSDNNPITEKIPAEHFRWTYARGSATTQHVFSQVDIVATSGLSRVFRLNLDVRSLQADDLNSAMPLITGALSDKQVNLLVAFLSNNLLQPNGLSMYPASAADNPSGVWIFWNAIICEALLLAEKNTIALEILRSLLRVQTETLRQTGVFTTFYQQDAPNGVGTGLDLNGVVPLRLILQAAGIEIRADGTVRLGEKFPWGTPIKIHQFGIVIERDAQQTVVTYPDGTSHTVAIGSAQLVQPPEGFQPAHPTLTHKDIPNPETTLQNQQTIRIEVEVEDATGESDE